MKLVTLTAADVDKLRQALPTAKAPAQTLHHEELQVDSLSFGLVRPSNSTDPRTNTYSISFRVGESEYVIVVRPTVHELPSITVDVVRKVGGAEGQMDFSSYTVLKDTVTTLKGRMSGVSVEQIVGTTGDVATSKVDLKSLLGQLKVQ
jgi:hypothetical protein